MTEVAKKMLVCSSLAVPLQHQFLLLFQLYETMKGPSKPRRLKCYCSLPAVCGDSLKMFHVCLS